MCIGDAEIEGNFQVLKKLQTRGVDEQAMTQHHISAELEVEVSVRHSGIMEKSKKFNLGIREGFLEEVALELCLED